MISLERFDRDRDAAWLVAFLTGNDWPFHTGASDEATVERRLTEGVYDADTTATFVVLEGGVPVGLVRVDDLDDDTPVLDVRVATSERARGVGTAALREVARWVFTTTPCQRLEGMTRDDNVAMRRAFVRAGFVKEAHHRLAWPSAAGLRHDAVAYGLLRRDWETGVTTPSTWHDRPDIDGG